MGFYQDLPDRKKKKTGENGAWEEEGSRYRGVKREKSGGDSRGQRASYGTRQQIGDSRGPRAPFGSRKDGDSRGSRTPYGTRQQNGENRGRRGPEEPGRGYRDPRSDRRESRDWAAPTDVRRDSRRRDSFSRAPQSERRELPVKAPQEITEKEFNYRDYEYVPAAAQAVGETGATPQENLLTGRNPIREALKSGRDLEKLLVQKGELSGSAREIVAMAKEKNVLVQVVDKSRLDEIAPHHQGLIAFASAYQYASVEEILNTAAERKEDPFIILLDGVTDPHNLGAVIRTADCAGAHGVIVPQHRSVGLTPAAVKASAGAVEHVKVARVVNLNRTIEDLQKRNIWVYAVTMNGTDYERVNFAGGTALVIGAEGEGISRLTAEKCDAAVSLPMAGKIESLNASVAAGIMMYRVVSCRRK